MDSVRLQLDEAHAAVGCRSRQAKRGVDPVKTTVGGGSCQASAGSRSCRGTLGWRSSASLWMLLLSRRSFSCDESHLVSILMFVVCNSGHDVS